MVKSTKFLGRLYKKRLREHSISRLYLSKLLRESWKHHHRKENIWCIFLSGILLRMTYSCFSHYYSLSFNPFWDQLWNMFKAFNRKQINLAGGAYRHWKNVLQIFYYFSSAFVLVFISGKVFQKIIFALNPYKSSIFSFDTPWYYELKGKLSETQDAQLIKLSCLGSSEQVPDAPGVQDYLWLRQWLQAGWLPGENH